MKLLLPRALAAAAIAFFLAGCDPDHSVPCGQAYDHLIEVAQRRPNPELKTRFVDACKGVWDEARHSCLMEAQTVEEALACRPKKVRPG